MWSRTEYNFMTERRGLQILDRRRVLDVSVSTERMKNLIWYSSTNDITPCYSESPSVKFDFLSDTWQYDSSLIDYEKWKSQEENDFSKSLDLNHNEFNRQLRDDTTHRRKRLHDKEFRIMVIVSTLSEQISLIRIILTFFMTYSEQTKVVWWIEELERIFNIVEIQYISFLSYLTLIIE